MPCHSEAPGASGEWKRQCHGETLPPSGYARKPEFWRTPSDLSAIAAALAVVVSAAALVLPKLGGASSAKDVANWANAAGAECQRFRPYAVNIAAEPAKLEESGSTADEANQAAGLYQTMGQDSLELSSSIARIPAPDKIQSKVTGAITDIDASGNAYEDLGRMVREGKSTSGYGSQRPKKCHGQRTCYPTLSWRPGCHVLQRSCLAREMPRASFCTST